jgi:hypothetical protein
MQGNNDGILGHEDILYVAPLLLAMITPVQGLFPVWKVGGMCLRRGG